jgi:exodeoxyribonuclease VII small subunit
MERTFEESLNELERIVKQLENGDLPLEESLKLFEEGVKLSRSCRERLAVAERRIEVLMKDTNGDLRIDSLEIDDPQEKSSSKRIVFDDDDDDDEPF